MSERPACRLCLEPADEMSYEDVIPEWLRDHLIASMDNPSEWSTLIRRVRTRICKRCNGRMNVAFEQPARSVIIRMVDGDTMCFSKADQRNVARWMMKVTLLYGLMRHWRDDMEPAVHPNGAANWDQTASQEQQRADLIRLIDDDEMPPDTTIAAVFASPEAGGKPFLPRTDACHGGHSHTNLLTMLFEVVIRDHEPARHRAIRRADPRWVVLWPPVAGESRSWPPKRRTPIVQIIKFQEIASRNGHFMTMGVQVEGNSPAELRQLIEDQGL